MENNLPKGWVEINIGQILISKKGKKPFSVSTTYKKEFVPYILIDEMEGKKIRYYTNDFSVPLANKKDVLLVWDGSIGKSASGLEGAIGSTIVCLTPKDEIPTRFLEYLIKHLNNYIKETSTGTGLQHINKNFFVDCIIPVPPLAEQQRIVAKLDAILARVNNCKTRLDKIPTLLKNFRQSVLAAAVSGELTKEWREKNIAESAEDLHKNLLRYREQQSKKINRSYKTNLQPVEDVENVELPISWKWTRLLNIAEVIGGVTKGRKFQGKKTIMLPYLRVANVQDGYLDLSEIKEIEVLPEDLEKYKLIDGDILFTEGGDRDKLGRGTIWREQLKNCIHQNHIFRARTFKEFVLPQYISIFTKTPIAKQYFFDKASQTVNLASINLTSLSNVPIALPPFEEQKEIVRKVEELFHFADSIEARYQKAKAWFDKIPQAILAKAFRGELVPQDENDEPASALLERIKKKKSEIKIQKLNNLSRPGRCMRRMIK
jgi:type I restriction enzyme S subunit